MGHTVIAKVWGSSVRFSEVDTQTHLYLLELCETAVYSSSGVASGLAKPYLPQGPQDGFWTENLAYYRKLNSGRGVQRYQRRGTPWHVQNQAFNAMTCLRKIYGLRIPGAYREGNIQEQNGLTLQMQACYVSRSMHIRVNTCSSEILLNAEFKQLFSIVNYLTVPKGRSKIDQCECLEVTV